MCYSAIYSRSFTKRLCEQIRILRLVQQGGNCAKESYKNAESTECGISGEGRRIRASNTEVCGNPGLKMVYANIVAARLREERDRWKALAEAPPPPSPILPESGSLSPSQIDASILDPEQAAILSTLTGSSSSALQEQSISRLKVIQDGLEFKTDRFLDGIHKLEQYQDTVSRVADRILALCATRLEERERREKEEVGTRDIPMQEVLRSLSRILPESRPGL